jgi:hypothetical protein
MHADAHFACSFYYYYYYYMHGVLRLREVGG